MGKALTYEQIERRQEQAVRFLRDVVGNPDLASEIESLTVEEYAARKGFALANPATTTPATRRKNTMSLSEQLERAHRVMDKIWNKHVDLDDDSDKDDLMAASDDTCDILNDYDPDRFPFEDDDEDAPDED